MSTPSPPPRRDRIAWATAAIAVLGMGVVAWASVTGWGGIVHGHPAYAALLVVTLVGCAVVTVSALRRRRTRRGRLITALRILLPVAGLVWIAAVAWLRPYPAVDPALAALVSDGSVTVTESVSEIVLTPATGPGTTGVLFQPGALVDPRAYAAVLRPLAEEGRTVVIAKQPLGIAFLATGALDAARSAHPEVGGWIVGGHSLGGTVAAIDANDPADTGAAATGSPVIGVLLFASYPATDMSDSLTVPVASISGTRDGLATPAEIDASRSDLPAQAVFTFIEGASHAQFGAYGAQPGDGAPQIGDGEARERISAATTAFVTASTR